MPLNFLLESPVQREVVSIKEELTPVSSSRFSWLFSFERFSAILLALTGIAALFFVIEAVRFLPVHGEDNYAESAGVLTAQRWAAGLPLYEDYRLPPHLMTPFPPLWYACLALASKLGFSDLDSLTLFGRILSLICVFGILGLGYLWNRKSGFSKRIALLTPAFYLSCPLLIPWAVTARPDFPAILLSLAAIYVCARSHRNWDVSLGAAAAALGFLARHNVVAAPIAIVLWLIYQRRWKHAFLFCASWSAIVVPTLVVFHSTSDGLLLLNFSGAKFGSFALTYARDMLARLLEWEGSGFTVALFSFGVFGFLESLRNRTTQTLLGCIYLVTSVLLAIVGTASAGGGVNHYLEPVLAMALLIPLGVAKLSVAWNSESPFAAFATVIVLFLLLPALDTQRSNVMHRTPQDLRRLGALVAGSQVFTDIPYLAARSSPPLLVDLAGFINTEKMGGWAAWSSASLVETLQSKRYKLVILSTPVEEAYVTGTGRYPRAARLNSAMQSAIEQNYNLCYELEGAFLYAPRAIDGQSTINRCPSLPQ